MESVGAANDNRILTTQERARIDEERMQNIQDGAQEVLQKSIKLENVVKALQRKISRSAASPVVVKLPK